MLSALPLRRPAPAPGAGLAALLGGALPVPPRAPRPAAPPRGARATGPAAAGRPVPPALLAAAGRRPDAPPPA